MAVSGRHRCRLAADTRVAQAVQRSSPTGVVVWVCTVVVGMLLRKATSAGVAASFVVVASVSTAVLLLGWRGVAALVARAADA